ncbi:MAG: DUF1464 family protein [Pyrodictiaceae archaeon]
MRILGIDPGTKSFDLVVVEDGRVVWEYSIETSRVASDPGSLMDTIREVGRVDAIAGPSGYGVPVTYSRDVVDPWRFAVEVLLLSSSRDIEEGVRRGDPGIMVYKALAETVTELCRAEVPTVFIPGVVHLPTLRPGAKYNRVDLGTADKLAVAVLAVYQFHRGNPREANMMVLEMGYGYNALMVIEEGRITWGLGGTSLGTGMLTAGPLDLEVVAMGRTWARSDVFHGGVMEACGTLDPAMAVEEARRGTGLCREAYESMMESIANAVSGIYARRGIGRLVISGRLISIKELVDDLASRLPGKIHVELLEPLEGAKATKHAAHGYALVVDGLIGGVASSVVERMRIRDACGTALDRASHPRLVEAKRRLLEAYKSSVRNPKLCN